MVFIHGFQILFVLHVSQHRKISLLSKNSTDEIFDTTIIQILTTNAALMHCKSSNRKLKRLKRRFLLWQINSCLKMIICRLTYHHSELCNSKLIEQEIKPSTNTRSSFPNSKIRITSDLIISETKESQLFLFRDQLN